MSEFIEVTEVGARRSATGERVIKDLRKFVINKDQVACLIPSERAQGCTEVVMSNGKPILVRGTFEQITVIKGASMGFTEVPEPKSAPFTPSTKALPDIPKPATKKKSKKKWGA